MARIKARNKPKPPRRSSLHSPSWLPLAVAITGVGLVLGPGVALPPGAILLGLILTAVGAYWLGHDNGAAAPDPHARSRVTQLERALLQLSYLLGGDGGSEREPRARQATPSVEHGYDAPTDRGVGSADDTGRATSRSLDDPLPGEE